MEEKLVPWGLRDVALGDRVLEVGPGFGATTRLIAGRLSETVLLVRPESEEAVLEELRKIGHTPRVIR